MNVMWKGVASLCAVFGLVALVATPAAASWTLSERTYASSGSYCATAEGYWFLQVHGGGQTTVVATMAGNYSRQYSGPSCTTQSPANAGVIAVWNHIERWNGSAVVVCKSTAWTANGQGAWAVYTGDGWLPLGCGSGLYRQHAQARITYAGTNHHSDNSSNPLVTGWEDL